MGLNNFFFSLMYHPDRRVTIVNRTGAVLSIVSFLFALVYWWVYGVDFVLLLIIPAFIIFFLLPIGLNQLGLVTLSRVALSLVFPLFTLLVSVWGKLQAPLEIQDSEFYDYRFILLCATILPFLLFQLRERVGLIVSVTVSFLCIVLFDPVHEWFGVGYFQSGQDDPSYYFSTVVVIACYVLEVSFLVVLRYFIEKQERINEKLIAELVEINEESNVQAEQILKQKAELDAAHEVLLQQKSQLAEFNLDLQHEVMQKNQLLSSANEELLKHNMALTQFSYTISHNLRGPVATLMGLLRLAQIEPLAHEQWIPHFSTSLARLDSVIRDLTQIVDLQNDMRLKREQVDIAREIEAVLTDLHNEIRQAQAAVSISGSVPPVLCVASFLRSILRELVTNAIKYSVPGRSSQVDIAMTDQMQTVQIVVTDNSEGIDLHAHGEKIFGLFKRFNTQVPGKGLGLYLSRLQAELMGATLTVVSQPGVGSTFTLLLRKDRPQQNIRFEDDVVAIYHHNAINAMVMEWKRRPSQSEYAKVYTHALELQTESPTDKWLCDFMQQGDIPQVYHGWMMEEIFPKMAALGLRVLACVVPKNLTVVAQRNLEADQVIFQNLNVSVSYFQSFAEAERHLSGRNNGLD